MTRRWAAAGVLTFAAGLTRPTAFALVAALAVAGLIAVVRRREDWRPPLAAVAIAPLGWRAIWPGWGVGYRMGDWGGYTKLQEGAWGHTFDYGLSTASTC